MLQTKKFVAPTKKEMDAHATLALRMMSGEISLIPPPEVLKVRPVCQKPQRQALQQFGSEDTPSSKKVSVPVMRAKSKKK